MFCVRIVAVSVFHVIVRQSGPEFDPARPLEEQTGWDDHAAFMESLVEEGHIILGGPLPNGRVAHAFEADSEDELRAIWARDPWHASPSRTSAYACCSVASPPRSDFTSVPMSTTPASTRSERW